MTDLRFNNPQSKTGAWRIAIMGGAYGNVPALQACIDDAHEKGCQTLAFIGDAIGCCGHSAEILALINRNFSLLVAGNYEQQAASGQNTCGCGYASAEDERLGCQAFELAQEGLNNDHRDWMRTWPTEVLLQTSAGPVLLCHGSPERTNEFLYLSEFSKARWKRYLEARQITGFVCTHTGLPWIQRVSTTHFALNCGVVGKPDHDGQTAVHYAILDFSSYGAVTASIESVRYNEIAWADDLRQQGVPDIFIGPLETGVWTTGLLSLPLAERPVHLGERCSELTIRAIRRELPNYARNVS